MCYGVFVLLEYLVEAKLVGMGQKECISVWGSFYGVEHVAGMET